MVEFGYDEILHFCHLIEYWSPQNTWLCFQAHCFDQKNKFIIQMKKCYSIFYFQYNFSISSLWFLFFPTLELVNVCFVSLYSWQSKLLKISVVFWLLPFGVNGRLRMKIKIRLFGDFVLGATRAQILTFPKIFSFLFVCWLVICTSDSSKSNFLSNVSYYYLFCLLTISSFSVFFCTFCANNELPFLV